MENQTQKIVQNELNLDVNSNNPHAHTHTHTHMMKNPQTRIQDL